MSDRSTPWAGQDVQRFAVYAWERDFVERAVPAEIMSRDQCDNFVRRASAHLGMRAPKVVYCKLDGNKCWAVPDTHELHIASWGRSHVTLLHEVAHLDTWPTVMRGEAPHGPTFVGSAMALYSFFLRIPVHELERTARMRGIQFVPPMAPALALPPR